MSIVRDLALVIGGAFVALAIQPAISTGQSSLERYASNLTAIAKAIKVDQAGSITIKSNTKVYILAPIVDVKASALVSVSGSLIRIGKGKLAPAANVLTPILCPPVAMGAPVSCRLLPKGGTVLIGP